MPLRSQCSRKVFQHGSVVVHWLSHVDVVFQASINSRVLFTEPIPTTEPPMGHLAFAQSRTMGGQISLLRRRDNLNLTYFRRMNDLVLWPP